MPTPYPDSNFHTKNVKQFADDVKAASGGKLEIVVHSNASLIKAPEIKRAVQTGQVNIGQILISTLANENPIFAFDSNPFLAPNYPAAKKLLRVARPYIEKRLDAQGIKVLFAVPWPPQGIYTKKPLNSIADLKGVKFRTYSPDTSEFAKLLGAIPTTVQVPEIPQAFLTGLVDAMITSGATGVDTQAWDYLKYYTDARAFLPFNFVIVNKAAFAKLDPALQKDAAGGRRQGRRARLGHQRGRGRGLQENHGKPRHHRAKAERKTCGRTQRHRQDHGAGLDEENRARRAGDH